LPGSAKSGFLRQRKTKKLTVVMGGGSGGKGQKS